MATLAARTYQMALSPIREMILLAEATEGVTRLEVGEPDFNTPDPIIRAAQQALDEGWTKYTGSAGILALREALARYDAPKLGRTPDPAREVCVTMGGTHSLFLAFLALLNPGDEVLVPDPGWPQNHGIIRLAGGMPVPYVLDVRKDFQVDRDTVLAGLSPRTKAILISSPSNPTGGVLMPDDLAFFAQVCQDRDLWAVSDEVYERIVFDGLSHHSIAALPGMAERTVAIGAFSKTFAMTGWRLGHIMGPPPVVESAIKFQGYVNTCPNAAVQRAGLTALQLPGDSLHWMVVEFQARRDLFVAELADIPGVQCVPPRGTFFIFVDFQAYGMPDAELGRHLLRAAKVSSIPGSAFGRQGRGFLRFSIVRSREEIRNGLRRVREALAALPAVR